MPSSKRNIMDMPPSSSSSSGAGRGSSKKSRGGDRERNKRSNADNDGGVVSRRSVFSRLGTKGSPGSQGGSGSGGMCRPWVENGECNYGSKCRFPHTNTNSGASSGCGRKKESGRKKVSSSGSRGSSGMKVPSSSSTQSPLIDPNWENWDEKNLDYDDELMLEKKRQLLQRELEKQMADESVAVASSNRSGSIHQDGKHSGRKTVSGGRHPTTSKVSANAISAPSKSIIRTSGASSTTSTSSDSESSESSSSSGESNSEDEDSDVDHQLGPARKKLKTSAVGSVVMSSDSNKRPFVDAKSHRSSSGSSSRHRHRHHHRHHLTSSSHRRTSSTSSSEGRRRRKERSSNGRSTKGSVNIGGKKSVSGRKSRRRDEKSSNGRKQNVTGGKRSRRSGEKKCAKTSERSKKSEESSKRLSTPSPSRHGRRSGAVGSGGVKNTDQKKDASTSGGRLASAVNPIQKGSERDKFGFYHAPPPPPTSSGTSHHRDDNGVSSKDSRKQNSAVGGSGGSGRGRSKTGIRKKGRGGDGGCGKRSISSDRRVSGGNAEFRRRSSHSPRAGGSKRGRSAVASERISRSSGSPTTASTGRSSSRKMTHPSYNTTSSTNLSSYRDPSVTRDRDLRRSDDPPGSGVGGSRRQQVGGRGGACSDTSGRQGSSWSSSSDSNRLSRNSGGGSGSRGPGSQTTKPRRGFGAAAPLPPSRLSEANSIRLEQRRGFRDDGGTGGLRRRASSPPRRGRSFSPRERLLPLQALQRDNNSVREERSPPAKNILPVNERLLAEALSSSSTTLLSTSKIQKDKQTSRVLGGGRDYRSNVKSPAVQSPVGDVRSREASVVSRKSASDLLSSPPTAHKGSGDNMSAVASEKSTKSKDLLVPRGDCGSDEDRCEDFRKEGGKFNLEEGEIGSSRAAKENSGSIKSIEDDGQIQVVDNDKQDMTQNRGIEMASDAVEDFSDFGDSDEELLRSQSSLEEMSRDRNSLKRDVSKRGDPLTKKCAKSNGLDQDEVDIDAMEEEGGTASSRPSASNGQAISETSDCDNATLSSGKDKKDENLLEGISDEDLEAVSDEDETKAKKAKFADALGVDWSTLMKMQEQRKKEAEEDASRMSSARKYWSPVAMFNRLGLPSKYVSEKVRQRIQEKLDAQSVAGEEKFEMLHPVAGIHSRLRDLREKRKNMFSGGNILLRVGMSAREDIAIRRHLCGLVEDEYADFVPPAGAADSELCRLAMEQLKATATITSAVQLPIIKAEGS